MTDEKPSNPLLPYYPSETPDLSGNVPRWVAILVLLWLIIGGGLVFLVEFGLM